MSALVGIFVGGAGRRMGGVPKGLLLAPGGEPLVLRLVRVAREAIDAPRIALIGEAAPYAKFGLPNLADEPPGIGPLGGLCALLAEAERSRAPYALALAVDLPYLEAPLLVRLVHHMPHASAAAPRPDGIWQPLCARYTPGPALCTARANIAQEKHALHAVFDALGPRAAELSVNSDELAQLRDWDSVADVTS